MFVSSVEKILSTAMEFELALRDNVAESVGIICEQVAPTIRKGCFDLVET